MVADQRLPVKSLSRLSVTPILGQNCRVVERFDHRSFGAGPLAAAKRGRLISVCLPARNEEATVGPIVDVIRRDLMDDTGLVDEILMVDDASSDGTTEAALAAGAKVVTADSVRPDLGSGTGKGEAMWKALLVASGDIVVFCDADVRNFNAGFVTGLLGPLLTIDHVRFVKGFYDRPFQGEAGQGGRVTE